MRIAIVTGASSGLGRESVIQIADRFASLDEIWVIARRQNRLDELEEQVPVRIRKLALDLTQEEDLKSLASCLEEIKPEVKWLINAAGFGKIGKVGQVDLTASTDMIDCNCRALCSVTQMVLPYMSGNSRIIQYASSAAFLPQPGFAVYAATKAFVVSYSRALHEELKPRDICVTAVCPGPVRTEFFDIAEETGSVAIYKKLVMANPKKVTAKALNDSMMGKTVSVYGIVMKLFRILAKILPHQWMLNAMALFN